MNKGIIIASTITAGVAALLLLLKKKQAASDQLDPAHASRSNNVTDTFTKDGKADQEDSSLAQGI